ncbi:MAG: glutathione S-transferase family protein [Hyphomicrobiaceae bacterium]
MKLYYTRTSPYARVVRTLIREKGLDARVAEIEAKTRTTDSPYYAINPSGRVPFLVCDDGRGIEDSQLICAYLDRLDGKPGFCPALSEGDWSYGRLEAYARSMTDGISVHARETRRPETERSPGIMRHELDRARRLADFWERELAAPAMQGPINMAQMLLLAGIDFARHVGMAELEQGRPALQGWADRLRARPSVATTAPRHASG